MTIFEAPFSSTFVGFILQSVEVPAHTGGYLKYAGNATLSTKLETGKADIFAQLLPSGGHKKLQSKHPLVKITPNTNWPAQPPTL